MPPPSAVGSSAGRHHTREPSGQRHRTPSVVSVGLGHAREPSATVYHTRESSGQRYSRDSSRRGSAQAMPIPVGRRNSTYGYSFGRRESIALPPPIIDDKYWIEGDFEIVTSDSVRFRVPSYYLFAAR
ncbi:hypothetical protein CC85DRAFT_282137 [Cutaneotrichosporon oleaginosum]|uniref:Uncharacterized protein n=1 Tax=Cutaneotrichosporon oleaginosum TaxID=879819 RepID=A0A0J0XY86_9TREE|nr:uncharacterized protein CC85DRAFT_282137 [Cutaneotrichosporon oleaginosum]KLT45996.1 hypothetical protein CC85DRAFT_282137 [Cutaneotrichosporon oleaginosum]TXT06690.1 hypothetical protein COLE_06021 [Cutaneotrichosporon oleaginosum]